MLDMQDAKKGHNMKNFINTSNIIKIKRESMTIVKGQTNIKIYSTNPRSVKNKKKYFFV